MSEKQTASMTPEPDGFAARYDRMVERSGSWVIKVVIGLVVVVAIIGLAQRFLG